MGGRHHFVPRLYLRQFSADRKSINVHNLHRNASFFTAPIDRQCYKWRLYGKNAEADRALQQVETEFAPLLSTMASIPRLPTDESERSLLLFFLATQVVRTQTAIAETGTLIDVLLDEGAHEAFGLTPESARAQADPARHCFT